MSRTAEERRAEERRRRQAAEMSHGAARRDPLPGRDPASLARWAADGELARQREQLGAMLGNARSWTGTMRGSVDAAEAQAAREQYVAALEGATAATGRAVGAWVDSGGKPATRPVAPRATPHAAPAPVSAPVGAPRQPDPSEFGPPRRAAADVVASLGALPIAEARADSSAPPLEQTEDPFSSEWRERVQPMIDEALARGRTDIAERISSEYSNVARNRWAALNAIFETETLPEVKRMHRELLRHKSKQLPSELANEARAVAMRAAEQQQQQLAYIYGALRDPVLAPLAVEMFNDSPFIEPGVKVREFQVDPASGVLYGIGDDGRPVNLLGGQPFAVPLDAADRLYERWYGAKREAYTLKPGERRYDERNRLVAEGGRDTTGAAGASAAFSRNLDDARRHVDSQFGRDTQTGILMNDTPEKREQYDAVMKRAEAYLAHGATPVQAASRAMADVTGLATATNSGGEYAGPRPWQR